MADSTPTVTRARPGSLRLTRPSPVVLAALLRDSAELPFSYAEVGATRNGVPPGFSSADREQVVGHGQAAWDRAVQALRSWTQFDLPWVRPHRRDVPIQPGEVFAFSTRQYGVWTLNTCRIVYVVDEEIDGVAQYGFAYGTLAGHMVRGEERFILTWDRESDEVRFRVHQFSQLAHPVVRALGPIARRVQARFNREAVERLAAEVQS